MNTIKVLKIECDDSVNCKAREENAWFLLNYHADVTEWRDRKFAIRELLKCPYIDSPEDLEDMTNNEIAGLLVEERLAEYYSYDAFNAETENLHARTYVEAIIN